MSDVWTKIDDALFEPEESISTVMPRLLWRNLLKNNENKAIKLSGYWQDEKEPVVSVKTGSARVFPILMPPVLSVNRSEKLVVTCSLLVKVDVGGSVKLSLSIPNTDTSGSAETTVTSSTYTMVHLSCEVSQTYLRQPTFAEVKIESERNGSAITSAYAERHATGLTKIDCPSTDWPFGTTKGPIHGEIVSYSGRKYYMGTLNDELSGINEYYVTLDKLYPDPDINHGKQINLYVLSSITFKSYSLHITSKASATSALAGTLPGQYVQGSLLRRIAEGNDLLYSNRRNYYGPGVNYSNPTGHTIHSRDKTFGTERDKGQNVSANVMSAMISPSADTAGFKVYIAVANVKPGTEAVRFKIRVDSAGAREMIHEVSSVVSPRIPSGIPANMWGNSDTLLPGEARNAHIFEYIGSWGWHVPKQYITVIGPYAEQDPYAGTPISSAEKRINILGAIITEIFQK